MNVNTNKHLNEDQLLMAIVGEEDLSSKQREHLSTCSACSAEKERYEHSLTHLGQLAELYSPLPGKRISLPLKKSKYNFSLFYMSRSHVFAAAAAMAVLIIVVWTSAWHGNTVLNNNLYEPVYETQKSEKFMAEINRLSDNALPQIYSDILDESEGDYTDEFIYFVVPPVESSSFSFKQNIKGGMLC